MTSNGLRKFKKVTIGAATIYHGDCLDVLDDVQQVDIVITSPPYNQLQQAGGRSIWNGRPWFERAANGYADNMPEPRYQIFLRERLDKCFERTRGLMWVNHKVRFRRKVGIHPLRILPYPLYCEVVWDRGVGTMAISAKRFQVSHEYLYGFGLPHYWNRANDGLGSIWRIRPASDPSHPCVFPRKLIEAPIIASCPIGGVVLDPFAGTGRAGLVALANGRRCILIEKDEKHFHEIRSNIEALYKARPNRR